MKKLLLTSSMIISMVLIFAGCATETKWADTSAMISQFCGGSIYVSSKKVDATFGAYLQASGDKVDLYFVNINDYKPGETFDPAKDESSNFHVSKTVAEVNQAMLTNESMEKLFVSVAKEISGADITSCKVKYTDATICTRFNDGTTSCTANIVCDSVDLSVNYLFKGFDDLTCPDASLILTALKGDKTVHATDDSNKTKKDEIKKDGTTKSETKKSETKKSGSQNNGSQNNGTQDTETQKDTTKKAENKKDRPILMIPVLF